MHRNPVNIRKKARHLLSWAARVALGAPSYAAIALTTLTVQAEPPRSVPANQFAVSHIAGVSLALAAGLALPPEGGKLGLLLATDVRYGFEVSRVTLAPGLRLTGLFAPEVTLVGSLPTLLLVVPVSLLDVGVSAGPGLGYLSERSRWCPMYMIEVQLMVPLNNGGAFGLEASFYAVPGTGERVVFIGPVLTLSV